MEREYTASPGYDSAGFPREWEVDLKNEEQHRPSISRHHPYAYCHVRQPTNGTAKHTTFIFGDSREHDVKRISS